MVILNDFDSDRFNKVVDPWLGRNPDIKRQTAGDWYNIMLSAALGGKPVHGCNASPTCEVLCKAPSYGNLDTETGYIKWDPSTHNRPSIGSDISEQHYTHHAYKGTITASGNILAYESGLWEPSTRARAKSTSLLAAGIHAHGCSLSDAVNTVSIIASDDIDEEAVNSAILPASHLKREMTIVSKASHRIFSCGSIQSGIKWDDSGLNLGAHAKNMAFDWGRVTAIARYIAEANIQICTSFRSLARRIGIPYFIVRNSWAYVTATDYQLKPAIFAAVPRIDLAKYRIPSIKGAFLDHEDEIVIAITRSLDTRSLVPDSDTLRAYTNIYNAAKKREARKRKMKPVHVSDYLEIPIYAHSICAGNITSILNESSAPLDALSRAVTTRNAKDPEVRRLIECCLDMSGDVDKDNENLDAVSKVIFSKGTWLLARAIGESTASDTAVSKERADKYSDISINALLGKLKSNMFGYQTHVSSEVVFTESILVNLRRYTRDMIKDLTKYEPVTHISQLDLAGAEMKEVASIYSELADKAVMYLPEVRSAGKDIFKCWANKFDGITAPPYKQAWANYSIAAYALKHLDVRDCLHQTTGFVDGAAPEKTYVYLGVKKIAEKYDCTLPRLKRCLYANASQIAEEIDDAGILPYKVVEVVKFVNTILDNVIGEMFMDRAYKPSNDILSRFYDDLHVPGSPGYDDSMLVEAEDLAFLTAGLEELENERVKPSSDPYEQALATYPSISLADKYAKVSGYSDFKGAYLSLGDKVMNIESNDYIINAKTYIAMDLNSRPKESKKRGYSSII